MNKKNIRIIVENGSLPQPVIDSYVRILLRCCRRKDFSYIKFSLNATTMNIHYAFASIPFERIWNVDLPQQSGSAQKAGL